MSPLKLSLIAALASAALTAGGFHYLHKQKVRAVESLRAQNNRLLFQAHQSRPAAPEPTTPTAPAEQPAPQAKTQAAAPQPAENYRNEGQATPLAALQTFAWACDRGDTETVGRMLHFDPSARAKAEAFLASLPEKTRQKWKSLDDMAATELTFAIMSGPFPNADVLEVVRAEPSSDERTEFRLPGTRRDRTTFQKVGDAWKYVITDAMVDGYIRHASQNR